MERLPLSNSAVFLTLSWTGKRGKTSKQPRFTKYGQEPRDATWAQVIVGVDPDPANNARIIAWTKAYWEALHPYSAGGAYVNFLMEEGQERIQTTYRDNYDRLVMIKNTYNPTNRFRVNQNITPTV